MSSNIGSSFLSAFRNGIKFAERLFRNTLSQGKWILTQSKWGHAEICGLYHQQFGEALPQAASIGIGVLIALLAILFFIPLFFWAILKSI